MAIEGIPAGEEWEEYDETLDETPAEEEDGA